MCFRFIPLRSACLAVICALLASCGGGEPASEEDDSAPAKDDQGDTEREGRDGAIKAQLVQARRDAENAMADRDWPLARKLLNDALQQAKQAGHDFEIERARMLLLIGDVEREGGTELDARRYYADAMAVYRVQGDDQGRFTVHLSQGDLEAGRGDYAAAAREYDAAEALLGAVEDRRLEGEFLIRKGKLASRQMRHSDAIEAFAEAAKLFDIIKNRRARAEALLALAGEEDALDNERNCRRALDKALSIFRDVGDKDGEVRALHKAASLAVRAKQYRKARKLLKKVRELYLALDRQSDATKVLQHLSALPE